MTDTAEAMLDKLPSVGIEDLRQINWADPGEQLEHFARIALSVFSEPSDSHMAFLIATFGAVRTLSLLLGVDSISALQEEFSLTADDEEFATKHQRAVQRYQPRISLRSVQNAIAITQANKARTLLPSDLSFPFGLHDLDNHAPWLLWSKGNLSEVSCESSVSIVGTRTASEYGRNCTRLFSEIAAQENFTVISGGALGCDAEAHTAAIEAGGNTVAFFAGGIDLLYPWQNQDLFQRIISHGLLISESPPGVAPTKWRFLRRNRLIAAASRATLVVEAGWRSGTQNTANAAAELGRDVAIVPGPIDYFGSQGSFRIFSSMPTTLVYDRESFLTFLGRDELPTEARVADFLGSLDLRCLDALTATPKSTLALAKESGMSEFETNMALASLELVGLAKRTSGGWRRDKPKVAKPDH